MSGTVLENGMSRMGYRYMKVAQMGSAPDVETYMEFVPVEVNREDIKVTRSISEDGLGIYTLWLHWAAREFMRLMPPDKKSYRMAAWWWLGKTRKDKSYYTFAAGIDCAVALYCHSTRYWPVAVLVNKPLRHDRFTVRFGGAEAEIQVRVEEWVPERTVIAVGPVIMVAGKNPLHPSAGSGIATEMKEVAV
jgi:hypothetical protein